MEKIKKLKATDSPLQSLVVKENREYYARRYLLFRNDNVRLLKRKAELQREVKQLKITHKRKIAEIKRNLRETVNRIESPPKGKDK